MRKLITICAVVVTILAVSGVAQATNLTYSIVDYPQFQKDIKTGLTDHVSGTIIADPTTDVIASASFTIWMEGDGSYTVASATIKACVNVDVTPTEITFSQASPYGFLDLYDGTGQPSPNTNADLQWYTPANPWVNGTMDWAGYMGTVGSKGSGPLFAAGNVAPEFTYYPWVVATVVPEPATICLLAIGAATLLRRRKS